MKNSALHSAAQHRAVPGHGAFCCRDRWIFDHNSSTMHRPYISRTFTNSFCEIKGPGRKAASWSGRAWRLPWLQAGASAFARCARDRCK